MPFLSGESRKLLSRSLLAIVGGYALAAAFAAAAPLILPRLMDIQRGDAAVLGMLLSFLIFGLWILYSYAARCTLRASVNWLIWSTPLLLSLLLLEAPAP
ncbi:hypothetical protein [Shewanella khirikhana]|uniref:Iron uptake protein n=1 Tax=Shewanella khirikhana TaxID=1965282 RepID=A0ABM7DRS7_9GAMM|nr:hypothetical protein [Shewanella khirikhana]AZQ12404.1 hypothetical protein STH12_03344 [Shewanella khirikhana]